MVQTMVQPFPVSGDDPDQDSDIEASLPCEAIESNTELKLHVMGSKMLFTQRCPQCSIENELW